MNTFLLLIISAIFYLLFRTSRSKGSIGELKVNRKLNSLNRLGDNYQIFHNVTLKTFDGTTQIDHILISTHGIFVIETKNLTGWIFGGEYQKQWTQVLYKKKYKFQNPIHQNYKHVKALQRLLGTDIGSLVNLVVFVGDCKFKTEMPHNVVKLRELLPLIKSYASDILNEENIEKYVTILNDTIDNSPVTESEHINKLKQNSSDPICPRCGKPMVLRTAQKGSNAGSQFWGCSGFPSCKATRN